MTTTIPNLKRLNNHPRPFHSVIIGNYFVHMAETSRLLQKIGEAHVKVIQGQDEGCTFAYYGGYKGFEFAEAEDSWEERNERNAYYAGF